MTLGEISAWLPLGSLLVAAVAVFVGPWISARATERQIAAGLLSADKQIRAGLLSANKQIVAPMRQAWINSLREKAADVLSTAWWYYVSGEDPSGPDKDGLAGSRVEKRLRFVIQEIELMLNFGEPDHVELLELLNQTVNSCYRESSSPASFPDYHRDCAATCRRVLKKEWNRVREELPFNSASVIDNRARWLTNAETDKGAIEGGA